MKPARYLPFSLGKSSKGTREQNPARADQDLIAEAFDAEYYLSNNPDVAASGQDPLHHFIGHGWQEGRDPAPFFSMKDYLELNPDVAQAGGNPFVHFLKYGRDEGRVARKVSDPTTHSAHVRKLVVDNFDREHYLARNRDVAKVQIDPLEHFLKRGWNENRNPTPDFSIAAYLEAHPAVKLTGINPFAHYLLFGKALAEGETGRSGLTLEEQKAIVRRRFNPDFYRARNPDVAESGEDPLEHFLRRGWREGRDPAPDFSLSVYLAQHPEVRASGENPYIHALMARRRTDAAGQDLAKLSDKELRDLVEADFDADFYREHNPDIGADSDPITHYLRHGWKEGRFPAAWFSPAGYLAENEDVAKAGLEPFTHYVAIGRAEGRNATRTVPASPEALAEARAAIAEAFDSAFYRGINRDIGPDADPVAHYLDYGWREGRDPAPWFSTRTYLEMNTDVAEAESNPFVHYITTGRDEQRTVRRPFNRWQATSQRPDHLPPLPVYEPAPALLSAALVTRRIVEAVGVEASLIVSIGEVDPADATGSAGVALASEAATARAQGRPLLHAYPEAPRQNFAGRNEDPILRLEIGGTLIGSAKTSALVEALMAVRYTMLVDVIVHGLAGHSPERLAGYVGLSGGRRMLWLHDYWLACPCRRLMNPDGRVSNAVTGAPQHTCRFDTVRAEQQRRVALFLSEAKFSLLAPSLAAKRNARRLPVVDPQTIRVANPLGLESTGETPPTGRTGPIRVAFAADRLDDCAWPLFQELARRHAFDGNHEFITFNKRADLPHFIRHIPLGDGPMSVPALSVALTAAEVDVVVVAPGWPVPLSLPVHAALDAGCAIVSIEGSGNVAETAARATHHALYATDEAIIEAFSSGAVDALAERNRTEPHATISVTEKTAPFAETRSALY